MGWFDKQINKRREADERLLEEAFANVASVIMGDRSAQRMIDDRIVSKNAIGDILKAFHHQPVEIPDSIKGFEEQLEFSMRPYGLMCRKVELGAGWHRDAYGPMIAFTEKGNIPVALLPGTVRGYYFTDPVSGAKKQISMHTEKLFKLEGYCFYRPLPLKTLKIKDLLDYMWKSISTRDIVSVIIATAVATLVGILIPRLTQLLTGPVISGRDTDALIAIGISMVSIAFSIQMFGSVKALYQSRLTTKATLSVQSAMMMRLMTLPAGFFRRYSPGELRARSLSVNQLCSSLMNLILGAGLTSLASLVYVAQIFNYDASLAVSSFIIILITVSFSIISTLVQIKIDRQLMDLGAKESGMSFSLITGVQKIKLAGAEKRMFAKWMELFSKESKLSYDPPLFLKINGVISTAIALFSTIVIYYLAIRSGIDQSMYFAFSAAYNYLMGAFTALSGIAISVAQIKPILEMAEPFLSAEPETTEGKEMVTSISGGVEFDHITFRYTEDGPVILDDLSFKIKSGEYVAIVGKTGCGKSTIVRLLLGFEKPEKGAVYYDGRDINNLNKASLRRKIGTVMQDAGLFQGDIYSNIVITDPSLSMDAAWEAAEMAGVAEDIRQMPMQMNTMISEGQGGISGGQRQRLMIARAIAPKPKLLIFDEATSALDNKTQKMVSESLDGMGCTRIVIAHRLSTIRHCDRIIVIDEGRIIEDGTYDELISLNGYFAELVERQRTDR